MTPEFGDLIELEVKAVGLLLHRCGLGIDHLVFGRDADPVQHVEAFGVGCHEPVLDAVMDHLDEMPGAAGPDMQIAARRRATGAAGSVPITDSGGTTAAGAHIVYGTALLLLVSGSPDSVTVTLSVTAKFSSASSYNCTANDTQNVEAIQVENLDGANFTLIGSGDLDIVSYICVGN